MLSVSTGADFRYYLEVAGAPKENYYTAAVLDGEPAGRWSGRGAAVLGLSGEVSSEAMEALYAHRLDPRDDRFARRAEWGTAPTLSAPRRRYQTAGEAYERLLAAEPDATPERREVLRLNAERSVRSNVQYVDVTFSVQKSITVLHAAFERQMVDAERGGDKATAAAWRAHRDAVEVAIWAGNQAALDYLQAEAGYSRVGHHGGGAAGRYIDAHDWVITSFFQHDSRDGDPQLHIHNPILNLAQCSDRQWRTLDSRGIHRHRPAAAVLAERVTEEHLSQALGVRFATRPDGKAREVVGVRPEVMELFSSRRRRITAKTEDLVGAFTSRYGRAPNALELDRLQRRATLATRQPKQHDGETTEQRLDRWDAELRAEVADGLAGVARDVLGLVDQPRDPVRWSPAAVDETALADVQTARSTWTRPELIRAVSDALPDDLGGLDPHQVRELLDRLTDQALAHAAVEQVAGERDTARPDVPELLLADGRSAYDSPAGRRYALTGHLDAERALERAAIEIGAPALTAERAVTAIARLAETGLTLGPDQEYALTGILTSGAKLETLIGPAGTGKSTVVGALARVWSDSGTWADQPVEDQTRPSRSKPRVVGLAASQAATEVLASEGLAERNVARWLSSQQRLANGAAHGSDADWRLAAGDLIVVDEAAMLSTADLTAIRGHAERAKVKLLLTGDHLQLAAVRAGGGMALLAKAGGHELAEVRRFTADWEGPASLRLRDRDSAVLHDYRKHGRLLDAGTPEQARTSAARAWLADTLAGRRSVLVVGSNEEAARLSAEVRAELVRLGRVAEAGVSLRRDGTMAGVGDLVQARRNGWELFGFNGNQLVPINRQTYRVVVARDDGGLVVEPADKGEAGASLTLPAAYVAADLTLGYAATVHSVQGRTVDTAHVVVNAGLSPEALYVGMSRGRHGNHAHVVTRPDNDQQPVGAVHFTPRVDPLGVLAGILAADSDTRDLDPARAAVEQARDDAARRTSVQTAIERFAAEADMVYTTRTTATLDRLTTEGKLTADERLAFAGDTGGTTAVARLLRTAELAGHDPDQVLAEAIGRRSFTGARSLTQVTYRRIEQQLAGRLTPNPATYAEMLPAVARPDWQRRLQLLAAAADDRRRQLGEQAAEKPPQWAAENLGPAPEDPVGRLDWEHRAGIVAAWRELSGHTDPADALGMAARPGQPEHYAAWRAAWIALGRPDAERAEAELSDGQLRMRVRAHAREENWAPAYVGESLTATTLAAEARRRDAQLAFARAQARDDPAEADRLRREAADTAALADVLDHRVRQLEEADQVRGRWLAHTAVTRDAADRARAQLAARGAPLGPEADDAVTAAEWLAAHRADQVEGDRHRPINDEHDLAEMVDQRTADRTASGAAAAAGLAETSIPDARHTAAGHVLVDEPGRIPEAAECQAAVRRAQAALAEIEQRRTLDERRDAEERRAQQLNQWAHDDQAATAAADQHIDARAVAS